MCLSSAPTRRPSRMPSPSSYVDPSVNSFDPSAGVCSATMSAFITKPPAAITTARARTRPVSAKRRQASPAMPPAVVGDEVGRPGLVAHLDTGLLDPLAQEVHHQPGALGVAGHRDLVAARRGHGLLLEGPHLLVAGEHQPLGAGLDHGLAGEVGALELEAQRLDPVEVLDRSLAVGADLVVLGLLGGGDEVLVHLLDGVLVSGGLLHRRTAAEVEVAAGHARGAAVDRSPLEQQHPGPGAGGLQGCAAAGDAEADHHDVEGLGVLRDHGGGEDLGQLGALGLDGRFARGRVCHEPRVGRVGELEQVPVSRPSRDASLCAWQGGRGGWAARSSG